jgi:hypothetical protein
MPQWWGELQKRGENTTMLEARKVGTRVCAAVRIQVNKRVFVPEGELGTVVDHYQEGVFGNGIVVKWDHPQDGLQYWDNTSLLVGEDVVLVQPVVLPRHLSLVPSTMSIAAALMLSSWGNSILSYLIDLMVFVDRVEWL